MRRNGCSATRSFRRKTWLPRRESTPHSVDGGRVEVPILKQGHYLIASIQSALTDADLSQLREALVERVGRFRSRGVIVDVTALDVMDSFAVRTLRDIAHMARLRGAETVIVGIQPEVAFAMVQLGLTLKGVATALDLEEGLAFLDDVAGARAAGRVLHLGRARPRSPRRETPDGRVRRFLGRWEGDDRDHEEVAAARLLRRSWTVPP